jgi:hypothetical protein
MNPKLIVIDGKAYYSVDEMPEGMHRRYEQALAALLLFLCLVGGSATGIFPALDPGSNITFQRLGFD